MPIDTCRLKFPKPAVFAIDKKVLVEFNNEWKKLIQKQEKTFKYKTLWLYLIFLQLETFVNQVKLTTKDTEVDFFLLIIKKLIFTRCHNSYIVFNEK